VLVGAAMAALALIVSGFVAFQTMRALPAALRSEEVRYAVRDAEVRRFG
jgi:hypothetical protein